MSTIPLPALDIRPPQQQTNPLEEAARVVQLRDLMQNAPLQHQLLQQQQQAGALELQSQQRMMDSQNAIMSAYSSSNGDLTKTLQAASQSGKVLPNDLAKLQQANYQVQSEAIKLWQAKGDRAVQEADYAAGAADAVKNAPPEQKANVYQQQLANLQKQGVDVSQLPQQYPGDQQFSMMNLGLQSHKTALEQAKTLAQTQEAGAKAGEATANTQKTNAELDFYKKVAGAPGVPPEVQQQADWLSKNPGKGPSDFLAWKAKQVPLANFNLQNAGIGGGPGGQPSALAKMVASGQAKWGDVISPRTPQSVKEAFAKEVQQINPNFDTSTYGLETEAAKKATSGAWSDTRLAYNTALDHSDLLLQASKALNNGDVQALNSLKNKFGTEFGATGPITFNAIANAYNHEVTSVVAKGHMTDKEVETGGASLPANASPQQIQSVVGAYKALMGSKRDELDKIIKAGAGNKANGVLNTQSNSGGTVTRYKIVNGELVPE